MQPPVDRVYHRGVDRTGIVDCVFNETVSKDVYWIVTLSNSLGPLLAYSAGQISPDFRDKYSVSGTNGNYSLVIKDLNRSDTGQYTCLGKHASVVVAGE